MLLVKGSRGYQERVGAIGKMYEVNRKELSGKG